MTRKEYYTRILEMVSETNYEDTQDMMEFLTHQIEVVSRQSTPSKKETAHKLENEHLKEEIVATLRNANEPRLSLGQLQIASPALAELSNQKVSSLLRQLINEGVVDRGKDKRTSVYYLTE